jgi:hypothetical protein
MAGLPAAPHCSCLEIAGDGRGGHVLYLATYGRNVWHAQLDYVRRFEPPRLPQQVANILIGVIDDGGGLIRVGNRIVRIPPRPPADRMVDGIAKYAEAATLPAKQRRVARLAALRDIEKAVAREIKKLDGRPG